MSKPNPFLDDTNPANRALYEDGAHRLGMMAKVMRGREEIDDENLWVGKQLSRCDAYAIVILLAKKGILTIDEFLIEASNQIEEFVDKEQEKMGLLITAEKVFHNKVAAEQSKEKKRGRKVRQIGGGPG